MDISQIGAVERPSYRLRYIDSKGNSKSLYFTSLESMSNAKKQLRAKGREVTEESLNPALVYDKEADDYFTRSSKTKDLPLERDPFPYSREALRRNKSAGTYRVKKVSKSSKVFYEPQDLPMFKGSRYIKGTDTEQTSPLKTALIVGGLFAVGYLYTQNQIKKAYSK
jgi:hypothetical protein